MQQNKSMAPVAKRGRPKRELADGDDSARKPVVVRFPGDLLKRIDLVARRKGISRSAFIVSTAADFVHEDGA